MFRNSSSKKYEEKDLISSKLKYTKQYLAESNKTNRKRGFISTTSTGNTLTLQRVSKATS